MRSVLVLVAVALFGASEIGVAAPASQTSNDAQVDTSWAPSLMAVEPEPISKHGRAPYPSPRTAEEDTQTPAYFFPYFCLGSSGCGFYGDWTTIIEGLHIPISTSAIGSAFYLDGVTTSYVISWAVNGSNYHNDSLTLDGSTGCDPGDYFVPVLLGGSGYCFSSGMHALSLNYPFGKFGNWTYKVTGDGIPISQVAFVVDPLVIEKVSGDELTVPSNTDIGPRLVVQMQTADGREVQYPILGTTHFPTAAISSGGGKATAIPTSAMTQLDIPGATFAIDVTVGGKGTYTVTVKHGEADPNKPAVFKVNVVDKLPPQDNASNEQGNGDAGDDLEEKSLTERARALAGSDCSRPPELRGDPINVTDGNIIRMDVDYAQTGLSPIEFTRAYNSKGSKSRLTGDYWTTTYDRFVILPASAGNPIRLRRPDGQTIRFVQSGNSYVADPFFHGTLVQNGTGWRYVDTNRSIEDYDSAGRLITITDLHGRVQTLTYSNKGLLKKVAANTGESLAFAYNSDGQISAVTDQAKRTWIYGYDGYLNLTSVRYPDGVYQTYFYEDQTNPYLLTGGYVGDALASSDINQFVTWEYDEYGRATANYFTGKATGTAPIRRIDITYNGDGTVGALDGNGNTSVYETRSVNGRGFVKSTAGPGLSTCGDDLARTFDSSMNVTSITQFGRTTTFNNYDAKGQFANRVVAYGSASERETDFVYDPRYVAKPTQITEPSTVPGYSKTTYLAYDDYGNVTRKTVSGFRPNLDPTKPPTPLSRTWSFQYDGPFHQLSLIDGPRTDVTDTITITYNPAGRALSVTDANGIVRRNNFTYTATGNIESEDRPNGLHVAYMYYDGNDLLQSVTEEQGTSQRTTTWTYDVFRRVKSITFSDGVNTDQSVNFDYYDSGDLRAVRSAAGTVTISRDDQGNPVHESYSRANGGSEQYWIKRTFDAYNRVSQVISANNTIEYDHYPDGTLTQTKDGKQQATQRFYDELKRLTKIVRPDLSEINFAYDLAGNLDEVTDPNSATTTYLYDDLGDKVAQISPDTGTEVYGYDEAGDLIDSTDAKGAVTQYTYDAGGRLLTIDRKGAENDETYAYDACTNGIGLLCSISNTIGESTSYDYDGFGKIAQITTGNGSIGYQYDAQGHVVQITYPSGRTVIYLYNGGGQVTNVGVVENGSGLTLASNVTYKPFGPVTGWTYGNGLKEVREYDQQYWPSSIAAENASSLGYSQYDANGNLRTLVVDGVTEQFTYDAFDQLQTASGDFGVRSYLYDPVGNRTSVTADGVTSTYGYDPNSNRIASETGWNYTLDGNGNVTEKRATDGSGQGLRFVYSQNNRLSAVYDVSAPTVPRATYVYNALGQRASKTVGGVLTRYVYGLDGKLLSEMDASGNITQEYVYLNGAPLALLGKPSTTTPPPTSYDDTKDNDSSAPGGYVEKKDKKAVNGAYLYCDSSALGQALAPEGWTLQVPVDGYYDLYVTWMWPSNAQGTSYYNLDYNSTTGGAAIFAVDRTSQAKGAWTKLGNVFMNAGSHSLTSFCNGYSGSKIDAYVDAVRVVLTQAFGSTSDYQFVHTDHLGTPRVVTNSNGTVIWKATYDPFGQATVNDDVANTGASTLLNLRFPGQYFDAESGLHYNYLRDYDPIVGRYVESDQAGLQGGLNTYLYVAGNPIIYIDPVGLDWRSTLSDYWNDSVAGFQSESFIEFAERNLAALPGDGAILAGIGRIGRITRIEQCAATELPQITKNRIAGNAFRDELAGILKQSGRDVQTEVYKWTPFGKRFIDIEVSDPAGVLGGVETKVGSSRYTTLQQLKDWWLINVEGYPVNVARKP